MPAITALKQSHCLIAAQTVGSRSTVTPPPSGWQLKKKLPTCSAPERRMKLNSFSPPVANIKPQVFLFKKKEAEAHLSGVLQLLNVSTLCHAGEY